MTDSVDNLGSKSNNFQPQAAAANAAQLAINCVRYSEQNY